MERYFIVFLLVAVLSTAGCSKYSRPPLVQVDGTVQYKGEPLEKGTVVFDVAGSTTGNAGIENGRIVNPTTYHQGDGIPVGNAKIAVYATREVRSSAAPSDSKYPEGHPGNTSDSGPASTVSLIPTKYNNPQTSGLTCTLEKGKMNTLHLELE
ncbi:hypothetical protein FACS189443_6750 [Planctomycetales bacterium]|nr:hypothetical protein FACS189443_6750 [Planctomycetales bacterium]